VRRWAWLTAGVVVAGALAALGAARVFGRRGSRPATLISVVTMWLGAWVLWSFAGGLAARYGVLDTYEGSLFAAVAAIGGIWQYRVQVGEGRERGLVVFVGAQLLWLGIVLVQNGVLSR
jgi:hypothetical protein